MPIDGSIDLDEFFRKKKTLLGADFEPIGQTGPVATAPEQDTPYSGEAAPAAPNPQAGPTPRQIPDNIPEVFTGLNQPIAGAPAQRVAPPPRTNPNTILNSATRTHTNAKFYNRKRKTLLAGN